jgi:hypothetical protein
MLPGGEEMVMMGSGLGTYGHSASAVVGVTACEGSEWMSESSVMCKTPAGVLKTLRVTLTIGDQVMSMSGAASYESAIVSGAGREAEDGAEAARGAGVREEAGGEEREERGEEGEWNH